MARARLAIQIATCAVSMLIAAIVAFELYSRSYIERAVREYPHDGMIGLEALLEALPVAGIVALAVGIIVIAAFKLRDP